MTNLLIASGGGHLKQLRSLVPRLPDVDADDTVWVTYDTPQSRSLLRGEHVVFAHHPTTRNIPNALRNLRLARDVVRDLEPGLAISTGAAIAVPFLSVAAHRGWDAHYIESATRVAGPSLSGRLLSVAPAVHRYAQYRTWLRGSWRFGGSVFDRFSVGRRDAPRLRRVVVSLGTHEMFEFPRLLRALVRAMPPDVDVVWQTGATPTDGLAIDARPSLPADEFDMCLREADVVVAHAGVGIALAALEAGKCPILVPRRRQFGEHVDDHQAQLAKELSDRGLALWREADECSLLQMQLAASRMASAVEPPPLDLVRSA